MVSELQKRLFTSILQNRFLKNLKVMESLFKMNTFKSLKEVMESFFNIKNFKNRKKVMQPHFSIKNFTSPKALMEFFLSFRSFKSRKKMTDDTNKWFYIHNVRSNRPEFSVIQLFRTFLEIPAEESLC